MPFESTHSSNSVPLIIPSQIKPNRNIPPGRLMITTYQIWKHISPASHHLDYSYLDPNALKSWIIFKSAITRACPLLRSYQSQPRKSNQSGKFEPVNSSCDRGADCDFSPTFQSPQSFTLDAQNAAVPDDSVAVRGVPAQPHAAKLNQTLTWATLRGYKARTARNTTQSDTYGSSQPNASSHVT